MQGSISANTRRIGTRTKTTRCSVHASAQIRRQHIQGMGVDISVGESLDDLADLLERAHAPFRDLTWEQIFPMPTAGALAGDRNS